MPDASLLDRHFPRYTKNDPLVPVWCLTPGLDACFHRFFDTSPLSPDGTKLACTKLPFEDRLNEPGEAARIVLVDMTTGETKDLAETIGWEFQMGANINWSGDTHVVFNDVDKETWTPVLVRMNVETGEQQRIVGAGVYHVSPDGRHATAGSTEKMRRTQPGYGVMVPDEHSRRNVGAVDDDGLWITDLQTGERKLLVSIRDAIKVVPELKDLDEEALNAWEIYNFHSQWNPQGDRIMFTLRRYQHEGQNRFDAFARQKEGKRVRFEVLTCRPDGSDLHDAIPAERWNLAGHHTRWFPDGRHLSANIKLAEDEPMSLIRVAHDGSDFRKIVHNTKGSGHPTVHRDQTHLVTDTYAHEANEGVIPLRWIDIENDSEQRVVHIKSRVEPKRGGPLRVDPHPAWDATWRWVSFNAVDEAANTRRVYLADFGALIPG
jgi:hypothetical protein